MQQFQENIRDLNKTLQKYMDLHDNGSQHYFKYFINILSRFDQVLETGALTILVDLFILKIMPSTQSAGNQFFTQAKQQWDIMINKLYVTCDKIPDGTTVDNDELLQSFKVLTKGLDKIIFNIQSDASLLLKPFKSEVISLIIDVRYYFEILYLMRKHNIEHADLINLTKLSASIHYMIQSNQKKNSAAVSIPCDDKPVIMMLELIEKILATPQHCYYFQFYDNNDTYYINWCNALPLVKELMTIASSSALSGVSANLMGKLKLKAEEFSQRVKGYHRGILSTCDDNRKWNSTILAALEKVKFNFELGLTKHCNPHFSSDANDVIKSSVSILLANICSVNLLYTRFNKMPFRAQPDEFILSFIHRLLVDEIGIVRQLLTGCHDRVTSKKHPIVQIFNFTFANGFKEDAKGRIEDAVNLRIMTVFKEPTEFDSNMTTQNSASK